MVLREGGFGCYLEIFCLLCDGDRETSAILCIFANFCIAFILTRTECASDSLQNVLQVVRRRRGDVHGDLTVVVLQLAAAASAAAAPAALQPAQAPGSALPPAAGRAVAGRALGAEAARRRAAARWALLRMHFVAYRRAARAHTLAQWDQVRYRSSVCVCATLCLQLFVAWEVASGVSGALMRSCGRSQPR